MGLFTRGYAVEGRRGGGGGGGGLDWWIQIHVDKRRTKVKRHQGWYVG